ncbi:hypothetical protein K1T73_15775 [Roseovarius sp. SCSIO 43702]|uniref:hypothetical protein n=1 Tax=Roseovarius sp. SCSIO 43702 TaxID=2823043 RepID=UPI001C730581|nr:hypothetical protein [Roseovarius sp. SCSIO 43702]QYX56487.1 hypothetical protein K1T73_15775 [Roseovarius sp. SCSIO 43702]
MMTVSKKALRGGRMLGLLVAAMAVQGCEDNGFRGRDTGEEQAVVPSAQTVTSVSSAKPVAKPKAKPANASPAPTRSTPVPSEATRDLDLRVTYYVRLMVPPGSKLTVTADGSGTPVSKSVTTEGGPPYHVTLPVPQATAAYPMKITATLDSAVGHVLEGEVTLSEMPDGEIEVVMSPKSAN